MLGLSATGLFRIDAQGSCHFGTTTLGPGRRVSKPSISCACPQCLLNIITLLRLSHDEHPLAAPSHRLMFDVSGSPPSIKSLNLLDFQPRVRFETPLYKVVSLPSGDCDCGDCGEGGWDQLNLVGLGRPAIEPISSL
jgi:hypothetical protein